MSIAHTIFGGAVVFGSLSLITQAIAPEPEFMTVHNLSYENGLISTERTVSGQPAIADWHVAVVGKDSASPTCSTIHGPNLHEGWSAYQPGRKVSEMSLDVWVGDPGCYERLHPGPVEMFVTWTPRDSRDPVAVRLGFEK